MPDVNPSADSREESAEADGPVIRDKRRLDPQTGQVRNADRSNAEGSSTVSQDPTADEPQAEQEPTTLGDDLPDMSTADERAAELQDELLREKAAFHNYRELMKRERPKDRDAAVSTVIESLLPVLDDIYLAREHGDLQGTPFEKIADKLDTTLARFGVASIGAAGDAFDPTMHEALMHVQAELPEGADSTTVVQVMQPGFKVGDRVVRPARVSVADPE